LQRAGCKANIKDLLSKNKEKENKKFVQMIIRYLKDNVALEELEK